MKRHRNCWDYIEQKARVKLPIFPLEILIDKITERFTFQIDTSFDGYLLIPYSVYKTLDLHKFELPPDLWSYGESISGELMPLRCSKALIKNIEMGFEEIVEIETFEQNEQFLIGLALLKKFQTILLGDKEQVCISLA